MYFQYLSTISIVVFEGLESREAVVYKTFVVGKYMGLEKWITGSWPQYRIYWIAEIYLFTFISTTFSLGIRRPCCLTEANDARNVAIFKGVIRPIFTEKLMNGEMEVLKILNNDLDERSSWNSEVFQIYTTEAKAVLVKRWESSSLRMQFLAR